ncbi:hypothetical protein OQZ33_07145 [Pedobacter sp. MC2016-05]|uniref:hypothetical protein n=1 Tax=Pedobacter sp. MC2016-05 TaxID=2994474 RepID=UPI0022480D1A|nr:hypothetical protein [Pedobacter sp. MC2016-05]MCX2474101.1 hypothetical protein [Pedobacter sp. MC2016-05]
MAIKPDGKNLRNFKNFPWQYALIVMLSGISLLFGIIIKSNADDKKYQKERIEYLRSYIKKSENDKAVWLREQTSKDDAEIERQQILIDSLQKLLLTRTDKNFEELKNILDIKSKNATITIKPRIR